MGRTETKRCRNIRRVLIALFIVAGYMLSTTFAVDYLEVQGEEQLVEMTALNLAFGAMGGSVPMRSNIVIGLLFILLPFLGFFFMFFDKKTNVKNFVGLGCGIIGLMSIMLFIGANIGIGALVSVLCYLLITMLSGIAVLMHAQDNPKEITTKLKKHVD